MNMLFTETPVTARVNPSIPARAPCGLYFVGAGMSTRLGPLFLGGYYEFSASIAVLLTRKFMNEHRKPRAVFYAKRRQRSSEDQRFASSIALHPD